MQASPQTLSSLRERNASSLRPRVLVKALNELTAAKFVSERDEIWLSDDISAFEALLNRTVPVCQTDCEEA